MARRNNAVKLLGFVRRNRPALMASTALQATVMLVVSLPVGAQPLPNARPAGGTVVAGAAAISRTGRNTRIDQSTRRAAIDWKSFDVGSQQSVIFSQPSSSSVALNRVTGPDPSQIAGRIDANGQFILVNQSGVNFYKGAQVNAAGVMISAANIKNENFIAGVMKFDQPGKPNARIDNQGSITVRQAGLAALVAPQVANSGVINAQLGHVVLAGAKTATLDLYGDGLLSLDVSNQVTQAPIDKDGKAATALVTNTGTIIADGGTVQLTARAADGIVQNLVQAGGMIRAATMGDQSGVVALNGVGGSIVVEGQLTASGNAPGTKGGAIEIVSNGNLSVASSARIDGSGKAGGGIIAIGTTLARAKDQKATSTQVPANTVIQNGATISADATAKGNGGRVAVLSEKLTDMAGTITGKAGPQGGNGGFVEVSGDKGFALTGAVDVSGSRGTTGTILLDPRDLTIGEARTDDDLLLGGGIILTALTAPLAATTPQIDFNAIPTNQLDAFISAAKVSNLVGDIDIQTSRDLTVTAPITLTTAKQNLTLEAGRDLTVALGGAITTRGDISLFAATPAPATPPEPRYPNFSATGKLTLNDAVIATGGAVRLNAGTGGIALNAAVSGTTITLSTSGDVSQTIGAMTAATLTGSARSATLDNPDNRIANLANFTIGGGEVGGTLLLTDTGPLNITGTVSAAFLGLTTRGPLLIGTADAPGSLKGGTVVLATTDEITEPNGSIAAGNFAARASSGNVLLTSVNNRIATSGGITAGNGDVVLVDDPTLVLTGPYSGNNLFFEVNGAGDTLVLGAATVIGAAASFGGPAVMTAATGGRISLVADNIVVGNSKSSVTVNTGTVELAPLSAIDTSLLATGGLVVGDPLLAIIHTNGGTLDVGGFTNVPAGATSPVASASSVSVGPANLTGIASTLRLDSTGPITQTTGPVVVANLTGSAGTSANLTDPTNQVGTLGAFTTTADFALVDNTALQVKGPVKDIGDRGTLSLTTKSGDLTLAGAVITANLVNLVSAGAINETGTLAAGTLGGSAAAAANLTGTNRIAALGDFTAGSFKLNNAADLLIAGTLNAAHAEIRAPSSQISLGDRATIITGGTARPSGPFNPTLAPSNDGTPGTLLQAANFTQIGSSTVLGLGDGPATLQVATAGHAQFDPPLGLQATYSWLILDLANGTAAGNVFVNALDVSYTTPGSANLSGSIAGITSGAAAAAGFIGPAINVNYLFNGCVIASTVCQPPTPPPPPTQAQLNVALTATLGAIEPLVAVAPPSLTSPPRLLMVALPLLSVPPPQLTDPDVVPPNITYLDY